MAPLNLTRDEAVQYLMDRINYERTIEVPYGEHRFNLDRMRRLASRLGNPQKQFPIIHVAGSKGKGSTSTMIAATLTACGYRTGLFTSPHLLRLEERISIDGHAISGDSLAAHVQTMTPSVRSMDEEALQAGASWDTPTFFELMTAAGLLHFAQERTAAVVLEVGLGGRLDSTNICTPLVSVITSIGLDHTRQLGDTLPKIAVEKAGIIKPNVPVVSGATEETSRAVIRQTASDRDAPLWELERDFQAHYRSGDGRLVDNVRTSSRFDFQVSADSQFPGESLPGVELTMLGRHQANNAALTLAVAAILRSSGWDLTEPAVRLGLSAAKCVSRIEVVAADPTTILDTAHNESSIQALLTTVEGAFPQSRDQRVIILAASRGKDVDKILRMLIPWCRQIVITQFLENPRAIPPERLLESAQSVAAEMEQPAELSTAVSPRAALASAQRIVQPDELLCITGSFFLAAEMDPLVRKLPAPSD